MVIDKSLRYSKQREKIYEYLCLSKEHPSAEKIYEDLRKDLPNISLGTIYRNLNLLHNLGKINIISSIDGIDHYDADLSNHYHFVCLKCNRIYDIENINEDALMSAFSIEKNFILTKIELKITGYCSKCKN